jgi:hypothetical protein
MKRCKTSLQRFINIGATIRAINKLQEWDAL